MKIIEHQVTTEPNEDGDVFFSYKILCEDDSDPLHGLCCYMTFPPKLLGHEEALRSKSSSMKERLAEWAALSEYFDMRSLRHDDLKRCASACESAWNRIDMTPIVSKEKSVAPSAAEAGA